MSAEINWRAKLQAGEKERLVRSSSRYVMLVVPALVCVGILQDFVWRLAMLVRHREIIESVPTGMSPAGYTAFEGLGLAFVGAIAVWAWGIVLNVGVQFGPDALTYWNWRGRRRDLRYNEIMAVAAVAQSFRPGRGPGAFLICTLQAPDGALRWTDRILLDARAPKVSEALRQELAARCRLAESDSDAAVLKRTGLEGDLPRLSLWRMV